MTTAPAPSDSLIRKGLGRVHLNSHRIGEALEIYAGVLRDCPEDVEAQLMLGDCYLAGGDAATATHLYTRARSLDPHHPAIDRRLWLAQAERAQLPETRAEAVPTDPEAIARLLQRLTDRETPVAEAEVNRAAQMLEEMINSRQPALAVAERLNEIDALLPALLELNVRQARAGGRPDLAEALDLLLQNIRPQLTTQSVISSQSSVISSQTDDWRLATDDWRLTTDSTPRRPTIHLGWIGPPGNVEDVAEIRRQVIRLAREFPQVCLVVGGIPEVYRLFDSLPESRRVFLPPVGADLHPALLAEMDILLVPLRDTPSNRMLSDRPLMAAGVRRIPWVASPIPAHRQWSEGGLLAATPDEWHGCLRRLILSPAEREQLGEAGRHKAEERETGRLGEAWFKAVGKSSD